MIIMKYFLFFLLVSFSKMLNAQSPFFPEEDLMPIGAYYYPEHWPEMQWERDLKRVAELGFEFTHFGEFAWAMMEPEEGKYSFDWLDKAVKIAADNGLKVIMCTPTPTPPVWLTQKHPEILTENATGITQQHGSRLHVSYNHPTYLYYVDKIVTELGKRYGNDERVWGWQLDNEPHYGTLYDYSPAQEKEFQIWLREKYSSIENLNNSWGTAFWSQVYNNFLQIQIPNANEAPQGANPHALLDFQRFTADQLAEALRFQANILEQHISEKQWITTNYAYYKFLPPVDLFRNQNDLDFASHTMYLLSTVLNYPSGDLAHRLGSGLELSFSNEMAASVNGYTGIMELQPGQINWGKYNSQPLPGAVKMWIWHSFALGDKFACTYRFRQPLFGSEQFHKGIIEPDGIAVSPGGQEYVQAIEEIYSLRKRYTSKVKVPDDYSSRATAFLWKQENLLDIENYRHNEKFDPWQHFYTYYDKLKTMGAPVTFLQEKDEFDVNKYPFMVAPAYQLLDEKLVNKWNNYVSNGGHLVLTTRTGLKDTLGHLWEGSLQRPIVDLIGAEIAYYDHLPPGKNGRIDFDGENYEWNVWGDILEPSAAEVWATYQDQFYQGKPAVVHRKLGKGTVTYLGVWSNDGELERQVLRKLYQQAGAKILNLPSYVFTEWRNGFWVSVNYTSENVKAPVPEDANILFGEAELAPGGYVVWENN